MAAGPTPYQFPAYAGTTPENTGEQPEKIDPKTGLPVIPTFLGALGLSELTPSVGDVFGNMFASQVGPGTSGASLASSLGLEPGGTAFSGVEGASNFGTQYVAPIAAAYGGYKLGQNLLDNKKDVKGGALAGAGAGAGLGTMFMPGVGTAVGAGLGGLLGGIGGAFGGSSDPNTLERRALQGKLIENTNLEEGLLIPTVSGKQVHLDADKYNVDFHQTPFTGKVVAMADPIAFALSYASGHPDRQNDLAGMLTNFALTDASNEKDARGNLLNFANNVGWNISQYRDVINQAYQQGKLPADKYQVFMRNLDSLAAKKGGAKGPAQPTQQQPLQINGPTVTR